MKWLWLQHSVHATSPKLVVPQQEEQQVKKKKKKNSIMGAGEKV